MTQARFPRLENCLFQWIDTMHCLKLELPPYLVIAKAFELAKTLEIPTSYVKGSWCWLNKFRAKKGLGLVLLCGEETKVNIEDQELLLLKDPAQNVYYMDETGLFYRLLQGVLC
jgi:hypothetical protein